MEYIESLRLIAGTYFTMLFIWVGVNAVISWGVGRFINTDPD